MYFADKKVAVLSPASPSGVEGGAERFYSGLISSLQEAGCDVTHLGHPVDESTFEGILAGYDHFSRLDLSAYDLVISTKAPTYAARHPNQVLYLVHTIRVFYDMFADVFPNAPAAVMQQRETIHRLDNDGLSGAKARFSIGHEVSARLRQWNGIDAEVLHPPLATSGFHCRPSEGYFFLPGRLHAWKRVDMVIEAVRRSALPMRLVVAGTGDAEVHLRGLAAGDPRITFAGRVSDDQLIDLYSRALAVPFVPLREDYGYVTLEAFASAKPVITCTDSGEPLRFVTHEQTGLVSAPDPDALRAAMERLHSNERRSALMGERGRHECAAITWPKVARRLLEAGFRSNRKLHPSADLEPRRHSVAVLDMQPIEPAVGGGRLRLLGVFHALGPDIDAHYVGTYDWPGERFRHHRLSPGLVETDVPLSDAHHAAAAALSGRCGGKTVIDVAFPVQCHLSPDYIAKVREVVSGADAVVFEHPWVYPLVQHDIRPEQVVVYDAQNVESLLRAQLLDESNPAERDLIRLVVDTEYSLCRRADLVFTCSKEESGQFQRLFDVDPAVVHVVPNGAMATNFAPTDPQQRSAFRNKAGLADGTPVAFFIGSPYPPNVDAARFIVEELAPELGEVTFVIGGGVGEAIVNHPANVRLTGPLTDGERAEWLGAADIAINPMFAGSGTNIKMFDFMSAGLPIVATPVGARGITAVSGGGIRLAGREGFGRAVRALVRDVGRLRELGRQNRHWMERDFSWESISPRAGDLIRAAVNARSDRTRAQANSRPRTRLVHFTTLGQRCGIGEYTGRLLETLVADGVDNYVVTCATPSLRPTGFGEEGRSEIGWYWDNESWTESTIDSGVVPRARAWGATDVLIQYHAAFFSGGQLVELARAFLRSGIAVTVVIHNLEGVDRESLRTLRREGCQLLSHSRREVAQARLEGIDLVRMPMMVPVRGPGAPRSIRDRDFRGRPPVIATTGFVRPHKGILALIESMPAVRARFPGARLILQCALYPSDDSRLELDACRRAIDRLGLGDAIDLDTEFRTIDHVHERLSEADLGVLPYGPSNEGGSASAATLLAAGLPVLLSSSPVFADTVEAGSIIAGTAPDEIAAAIVSTFASPQTYDDLGHRASRYVRLNCAPAIGARVLEIMRTQHEVQPLARAA